MIAETRWPPFVEDATGAAVVRGGQLKADLAGLVGERERKGADVLGRVKPGVFGEQFVVHRHGLEGAGARAAVLREPERVPAEVRANVEKHRAGPESRGEFAAFHAVDEAVVEKLPLNVAGRLELPPQALDLDGEALAAIAFPHPTQPDERLDDPPFSRMIRKPARVGVDDSVGERTGHRGLIKSVRHGRNPALARGHDTTRLALWRRCGSVFAVSSIPPAFTFASALFIAALFIGTPAASAADEAAIFDTQIRPLIKTYCLKCHSTEEQEGDLDLEVFTSLAEVKRHPKIWQNVAEQLANNEMPPKKKPQPSPEEKARLSGWVDSTLEAMALARAGDPGPVVLRRLSNAEYTYTLRDLTGVEALDPAREFPVDGAAGEGFTNTGAALVMSPSLLTKYLDAAKDIAGHAVLLPDGIRFSPATTRRDWTQETLAQIRAFYGGFTGVGGVETVTQQGIALDKNKGGSLPLDKYLAASLEVRDGAKSAEAVARERGLSAKYLGSLVKFLSAKEPSPLLDGLRERWRTAKVEDVPAMVAEIGEWQKTLWKFSSVGHIGKAGGPKAWMEPVTALAAQQESRVKLAAPASGNEVVLWLAAGDAGDGPVNDFVVWKEPKLVIPGRPAILLRDVRGFVGELTARRERILASTARALAAAAEAGGAKGGADVAVLAQRHGMDAGALKAWFDYLGIGPGSPIKLDYFTKPLPKAGEYDFVKGWGSPDLPSLLANSSDQQVRIPGNMKPHGVVVHPTPKLAAAVGWRSPVTAALRIEATVTDAHTDCGNGVAWSLELRHGNARQRLREGVTDGGKPVVIAPVENVSVQVGDLVSLVIRPRDGEHTCDLTDLELKLTTTGDAPQEWSLTHDVSGDVLAGNPHADKAGRDGVWHFYSEPVSGSAGGAAIPPGSLLARWQAAGQAAEKQQFAEAVQKLLTSTPPPAGSPDAALYGQLTSLTSPLFSQTATGNAPAGNAAQSKWGVDPALFGKHPNGSAMNAANLCVQAPSVIEVRLPAEFVAGSEFVTTGALDPVTGGEGSVQLQVLTTKPDARAGLRPARKTVADAAGAWSSSNQTVSFGAPIVVNEGSAARKRIESAFEGFRQMFPAALCYTKIVPVDEVVTLTLFHREDEPLSRLMLDDAQAAKLDRLWDELRYVSQDALTLVDAFEQIWQYSTQDGPNAPNGDKRLEPLREPINQRAAEFKQRLADTQPRHLDAVLEFADRAYRRPLTSAEAAELRGLYRKLRAEELPHEDAIRLTLARVLVAPAFLYRLEKAAPGREPGPVSDGELASRLSYFLWSSAPDAELRASAAAGRLHEPEVLVAQMRRMLRDPRVRRLATEFACQWIHVRDFDHLDEKSDRHFPTFTTLRGAMYEESLRFFTDLFQRDGAVSDILDADYAFLNEALAKHYGIPGVSGDAWRRVDGVKKFGRGGILGQATTLAKNSGASRTSPILRGNWVAEALLGDRLPKPPKDVPQLPEEEGTDTLTVRQLTEKHTADPRCAGCHSRIDPFGFALEGFDAIGRARDKDLAARPIDVKTMLRDGTPLEGLDGLRRYLLTTRRGEFTDQFCRKLLGYALGRSVQLSDRPLLAEMRGALEKNEGRITAALETIVRSRPFLHIRGKELASEE